MMTFRTDPSDEIRGHQLVRTAGPRSLFGKLAQTVLRHTLARHNWLAQDLVGAVSPRVPYPTGDAYGPFQEEMAAVYGRPLQSKADTNLSEVGTVDDEGDLFDGERHERNVRRRKMLGLVLAEIEAEVWPYLKEPPPGQTRPTLSPEVVHAFVQNFQAAYDFSRSQVAGAGAPFPDAETTAQPTLLPLLIVESVCIEGETLALDEPVSLHRMMDSIDLADRIDGYLDPADHHEPGIVTFQCSIGLEPEPLPCAETRSVWDRLHTHRASLINKHTREKELVFCCGDGKLAPNFAALQATPLPHTARFGQTVFVVTQLAPPPTVH